MTYFVGTSGFAFKEWKGPFYPAKLPDAEMLSFYASRFRAVELNNTFYRLPNEKNLLEWSERVPDGFRFALKASQRITHFAQLRDVGELTRHLADTVGVLGQKLGPTLYQLPPILKKDLGRLESFLEMLPKRRQSAIEFRHPSWFDDQVLDILRSRDVSLCVSDQDELQTPLSSTASWGYVRLHKLDYDDTGLARWAEWLREQPWRETFVFFKHDHAPGSGPPVAESLINKLVA